MNSRHDYGIRCSDYRLAFARHSLDLKQEKNYFAQGRIAWLANCLRQLSGRAAAVNYIHRSLRPGGLFALWENYPWNPGTRYVMSRIPFDRDAITLTAPETRRLLGAGGFEILRTDFLFIFPRVLSWFRCVEPLVTQLPLGGQYQVLCRKTLAGR